MIIDELITVLGYDIQGEADLKRYQSSVDSVTKKIATFAAVAGAAAGAAVAYLGKNVITLSAQFESYAATLETIEGSSEKARASLDWVADFAKTTPYNVAETTEAFIRLRAYGLDPMDGTLTSVGDAASAMGKSLMDGVEAVADAMTGENERLKAFGITASVKGDQVTYSWQQNGKQLTRTMKKSGTEIVKFIKETFGQRFGGAMLRQSKTWSGMVSNLGDTWDDFQRRIGEGGFFNTVKDRLGDLLDALGRLDDDGSLDRWAKSLSSGFTWAVDLAEISVRNLIGHFKFLSGWATNNPGLFDGLKNGLLVLAAVTFPRTAAILVLDDVLKTLEGGDSVIRDLATSLSELTGVDSDGIAKVLAAIATGVAGYTLAAGPIRAMAGSIRSLASALGGMAGPKIAEGIDNVAKAGGGAPDIAAGGKGKKRGFWPAVLGAGGTIASILGLGAIQRSSSRDMTESERQKMLASAQWQKEEQRNAYQKQQADTSRFQRDNPAPSGGFNAFQGFEDRLSGKQSATPPDTWSMLKLLNEKMTNWQSHVEGMSGEGALKGVNATLNDNKQDNRNQSVNPTITINQSVTQATAAPSALATASGAAVSGAVGAARVEQGPAF